VDEDDCAGGSGRGLEDGKGGGVVDGVSVHGGEKAWDVEVAGGEAVADVLGGVRCEGVDHEIAVEAVREGADSDLDGGFVAGETGDYGGAVKAGIVQFTDPAGGEVGGAGGWHVPAEDGAERGGVEAGLLLGEQGEEMLGEEMDVGVGDGNVAPWGLHLAMVARGRPGLHAVWAMRRESLRTPEVKESV